MYLIRPIKAEKLGPISIPSNESIFVYTSDQNLTLLYSSYLNMYRSMRHDVHFCISMQCTVLQDEFHQLNI